MCKGVGSVRYIAQPWETWESMNTIASRFGVTPEGLVAANPILNSVPLSPGIMLTIPGRPEVELANGTYIDYIHIQYSRSISSKLQRYHFTKCPNRKSGCDLAGHGPEVGLQVAREERIGWRRGYPPVPGGYRR